MVCGRDATQHSPLSTHRYPPTLCDLCGSAGENTPLRLLRPLRPTITHPRLSCPEGLSRPFVFGRRPPPLSVNFSVRRQEASVLSVAEKPPLFRVLRVFRGSIQARRFVFCRKERKGLKDAGEELVSSD